MGSSGKKRTTMAKLNRESKLRDKRADKEARKTARKLNAGNDLMSENSWEEPGITPADGDDEVTASDDEATASDVVTRPAARA
jgi:hypothetical protein